MRQPFVEYNRGLKEQIKHVSNNRVWNGLIKKRLNSQVSNVACLNIKMFQTCLKHVSNGFKTRLNVFQTKTPKKRFTISPLFIWRVTYFDRENEGSIFDAKIQVNLCFRRNMQVEHHRAKLKVLHYWKKRVQYRSKILGPKYAHKTRLRVKHAHICVFDTCMRYAQKANSLVFMS